VHDVKIREYYNNLTIHVKGLLDGCIPNYDEYALTKWQFYSILYLMTPVFIFTFYLRSLIAFMGLIGLIIVIYRLSNGKRTKSALNMKAVLLCLLFGFVISFLTAKMPWVYGVEQSDYLYHNRLLNDLVSREWPVRYPTGAALNYYLAYYLPAGLAGKISGSFMDAKAFLAIWTAVGLFLGFANLLEYVKLRKKGMRFVAFILFAFCMFSGWDWLEWYVSTGSIPAFPVHLEWPFGVGSMQYSSFISSLTWSPHHLLPALIAGPILLSQPVSGLIFLVAVAGLWSPFASIGLSYLLLVRLATRRLKNAPALISNSMIAGLISAPIIGFYLLHKTVGFTFAIHVPLMTYLLFLIGELGPFVLAIMIVWRHIGEERRIIPPILMFLTVLPLFYYNPPANDLVTRASSPLLIAVVAIILKHLAKVEKKSHYILVIILLFGGISTPYSELGRTTAGTFIDPPTSMVSDDAEDVYRIGSRTLGIPIIDMLQKTLWW
jgi:hypothetical protein